VKVLSVTKTLPADGTDVPVTFEVNGDTIIFEILVDNHPTDEAELCDFQFLSMTIDGKEFRAANPPPEGIANNDRLAIRPLLALFVGNDVHLPLAGGSELQILLDTENGVNDVAIEITVGFIGGQGATLN
jgi:hypothetical protein